MPLTAPNRSASRERWAYPYEPQPKQALAHRLRAKEVLYGGAAGGGKTDWLLAVAMQGIFYWQVNVLILRRTLGHLTQPEGIIPRLRGRIPRHIGRYNGQLHEWSFRHTDAVLKLGYLRHDGDVEQYMGAQLGIILWDQVEQFTEWQYRRMMHPLRIDEAHPAVARGFQPFMGSSANPGGVGHVWVKSRWIDEVPPGVVWQPSPTKEEPNPGTRVFVPAKLADNKYLGDDYRAQLEGLPPDEREALLHGNWDVYAGARFRHWRREVHVVSPESWPIPAGAGVRRGLGIDYGSSNPWCALWGALMGDGIIVVYRELYGVGLSPADQAGQIREVEARVGERGPGRPLPSWLDPACWARNPDEPDAQVIGAKSIVGGANPAPHGSIAWRYQQTGIPVLRANNDRRAGTVRIAEKLVVNPLDRLPRILVHDTCVNLIRTLPGIPRDKADPELYDTTGEDHAVDALRYLVMGLDPGAAGLDVAGARPIEGGSTGRTETAGNRDRGF